MSIPLFIGMLLATSILTSTIGYRIARGLNVNPSLVSTALLTIILFIIFRSVGENVGLDGIPVAAFIAFMLTQAAFECIQDKKGEITTTTIIKYQLTATSFVVVAWAVLVCIPAFFQTAFTVAFSVFHSAIH